MSSSSGSDETDSDEETVSSLEIGDFEDASGGWSEEVSSSEAGSSSEEEDSSDGTSEESSFNNRKGRATLESDSSSSSGDFESDSDESSGNSEPNSKPAIKIPVVQPTMKKPAVKSVVKKPAVDESESDDSSSDESEPKVKSPMKKPVVQLAMKKPEIKSAMKKPAKEDSDSDDSSSDESEPKVKSALKNSLVKSAIKQPAVKSAMKKSVPKSATKKSTESDSDASSKPKPKSASKKPVVKPAKKKSDDIAPPGISKDAYKRFFSKPVELSPEKQSSRVVSNEPSINHSKMMIKHVNDEMKKRLDELNSSQHSLRSCEDLIQGMKKDLLGSMDDIDDTIVGDISIQDESKKYKDLPGRPRSEMAVLRDKREMRLAKVRERIRAKEQAKELESDSKKFQEFESKINGRVGFDMSENACRERAYGWYTRMAMPPKDEMKQRIAGMSASSGVRVEDVDLLPWSASNRMVNVAKMQRFINEGFKKKIGPRRPMKKPTQKPSVFLPKICGNCCSQRPWVKKE